MGAITTNQTSQPLLGIDNETSVSTEIGEYDPSPLSPRSKLVYNQWKMDDNDTLLISGFFRQCNITLQPLSPDVTQLIASYYFKRYSRRKLKHKIVQMNAYLQRKNLRKRKQRSRWSLFILCLCLVLILIFAPDIAGLIVISRNNCDGSITSHLRIGCISHLVIVFCVSCIVYCLGSENQKGNAFVHRHQHVLIRSVFIVISVCVLFFLGWSVLGSILHSQMVSHRTYHTQCTDMLLSWIILKFILYGMVSLYALSLIGGDNLLANLIRNITMILVFGIVFGSDIAGFIVISVHKHCDVPTDGKTIAWNPSVSINWMHSAYELYIVIAVLYWQGGSISKGYFVWYYYDATDGFVFNCMAHCRMYIILRNRYEYIQQTMYKDGFGMDDHQIY
eukprot:626135_1